MSFWVLPTTADIGIRAFGRNANDLLQRNDEWHAIDCLRAWSRYKFDT